MLQSTVEPSPAEIPAEIFHTLAIFLDFRELDDLRKTAS